MLYYFLFRWVLRSPMHWSRYPCSLTQPLETPCSYASADGWVKSIFGIFFFVFFLILVYLSCELNLSYKSFSAGSENIGDITAKGESQMACVDLLGMGLGVLLSHFIGTSKSGMVLLYMILSTLEVFCAYRESKRWLAVFWLICGPLIISLFIFSLPPSLIFISTALFWEC